MKANEQLLQKLNDMALAFTLNETETEMGNIANKLHTLLENKLGLLTVTRKQKAVLLAMAEMLTEAQK